MRKVEQVGALMEEGGGVNDDMDQGCQEGRAAGRGGRRGLTTIPRDVGGVMGSEDTGLVPDGKSREAWAEEKVRLLALPERVQ
ncbi:hypothetical protein SARC_05517 [Sphaeroforma arctica JP610]|uniref:Uncharacterized protein n=1 Tax=Sphaeroforma arctica JP610 TaxID=667725 RepID=A0A0L0FZD7_9EUKA|nr:hypothetical protein SARC_05517 [Sphaeroforma arctica JP610]KNC82197.1 hypothetical protein SARC_05517 [Sphaeroforma arctica JP610]|eukprot:XP_014156099.1 hypothetical protein SARC_05517 [Sphaeroforma arctica JP610]